MSSRPVYRMCAQVATSAEYLRGHGRVAVDVTALRRLWQHLPVLGLVVLVCAVLRGSYCCGCGLSTWIKTLLLLLWHLFFSYCTDTHAVQRTRANRTENNTPFRRISLRREFFVALSSAHAVRVTWYWWVVCRPWLYFIVFSLTKMKLWIPPVPVFGPNE